MEENSIFPPLCWKYLASITLKFIDMHSTTFNKETQKNFLTRKQVADLLSIDLSTVHNWTKSGVLRAYRLGGRIYFKISDIENSLELIPNLKVGRGNHE